MFSLQHVFLGNAVMHILTVGGFLSGPKALGLDRIGLIRKSLPQVDKTPDSDRFTPVSVGPFSPQ